MANLERLTISSHQIGGPLPEELGNLENLESMYLGHVSSWHLRCITTFEDERARADRER